MEQDDLVDPVENSGGARTDHGHDLVAHRIGVLAFGLVGQNSEPRFEVITIKVLRKSTVWPWPSVRRPSSSTCSSTLNVGVGLLDLVEQDDLVGPPPPPR